MTRRGSPSCAQLGALVLLGASACTRGVLDAGWNQDGSSPASPDVTVQLPDAASNIADAGAPLLPVDSRNPVIVINDGVYDNWQGEYSLLLAHAGLLDLVGIVVSPGNTWPDLAANLDGWRQLLAAARDAGLSVLPTPIASDAEQLRRPDDGEPSATLPNASEGARYIVDTAARLGTPERPLVVATGGRLTDVADAYLLDPTVVERVVVVSSLGNGFSEAERIARMGVPNGEMDPWASELVARVFRYVQVSAYYDQFSDVPQERESELPDNPFGAWLAAKRAQIWRDPVAADQVSVLAVGLPNFTLAAERLAPAGLDGDVMTLAPDPTGRCWLVTASEGNAPREYLWQQLLEPSTFDP